MNQPLQPGPPVKPAAGTPPASTAVRPAAGMPPVPSTAVRPGAPAPKSQASSSILSKKMRLGDSLIAEGLINEEQLQQALALQKKSGKRLGAVLVEMHLVTEQDIVQILSKHLRTASWRLSYCRGFD